jgi:hypothetical protein
VFDDICIYFIVWFPWPLLKGPTVYPKTSASIYHYSLCNNPEESRSHLIRGGGLKLGMFGKTFFLSQWPILSPPEILKISPESSCISFWFLVRKAALLLCPTRGNTLRYYPTNYTYSLIYCLGKVERALRRLYTWKTESSPPHREYEGTEPGMEHFVMNPQPVVGRDSSVGIATRYGLDGPGIESRWGARFSATVQTVACGHPASYTIGTGSFPGVKRRGVNNPPQSSAEVKERVELFLYSPSGPSWPVIGWTLPLLLTYPQPITVSRFIWFFSWYCQDMKNRNVTFHTRSTACQYVHITNTNMWTLNCFCKNSCSRNSPAVCLLS